MEVLNAYLFNIKNEKTVILAKNIIEALNKAEKVDSGAEFVFYRSINLIR